MYINTVYCKALYKSCTIVFACKYHHFEYLITECRNLGGSMLALWQMQPHAVQFALPMPTLNFGFSTRKPMLYQLKPNFASSNGTQVSVIPCQLGQQYPVQKAVPSLLQTTNWPSLLNWNPHLVLHTNSNNSFRMICDAM